MDPFAIVYIVVSLVFLVMLAALAPVLVAVAVWAGANLLALGLAGLSSARVTTIPSARCGDGPDGHLDWQVLVARNDVPNEHP